MFVDIRDLPATDEDRRFVRSIPHGNRFSVFAEEIGSAPRSASYIFGFIG
jgi:hypothetical protein